MNEQNLIKALEVIARRQRDTAPVKLMVGASDKDNIVHNNKLVLLNACPAIIEALTAEGFYFDMAEELGGLVVSTFKNLGGQ